MLDSDKMHDYFGISSNAIPREKPVSYSPWLVLPLTQECPCVLLQSNDEFAARFNLVFHWKKEKMFERINMKEKQETVLREVFFIYLISLIYFYV